MNRLVAKRLFARDLLFSHFCCRFASDDSKITKQNPHIGAQKAVESLAEDNSTWVTTPMGESDLTYKTTMTNIAKDLTDRNSKDLLILSYSNFGIRLTDHTFLYGPVALFPRVALSWKVLTPDHITEESIEFFTLLEPRLDLLLIGVGDKENLDSVRHRIAPFLKKSRVPHEIHTTENAVQLFNFMNAEGRYVAAALYPPDNMVCGSFARQFDMDQEIDLDMFAQPVYPEQTAQVDKPTLYDLLWGDAVDKVRLGSGETEELPKDPKEKLFPPTEDKESPKDPKKRLTQEETKKLPEND